MSSLSIGGNPTLGAALASVARFRALEVLHLNACAITEIPASFGELVQLATLSLFENELRSLPDVVAKLPALRSLVVGQNPGTRRIRGTLRSFGVPCNVT